jgi:small subunit ribosomal protein S16
LVVIRMARGGARNRPFYHIVVADSRMPRDGRFIERLGYYNPRAPEDDASSLQIELDRVAYWVANGAKPSDAVKKMIRRGKARLAGKQEAPAS